MTQQIITCWTVATAQAFFDMQADNEDAGIVDMENKAAFHWVKRWQYLIDKGCPRVIAYDTIAARARKSRKTIQNYVRVYEYFGEDLEEYIPAGITYLTAAITRKKPEAFLDEALKSLNTNIETLLAEFEPNDGIEEPREPSPYPSYGWGIGRRLATLPTMDKHEAESHLKAIVEIFERNGIE